MAEICPFMSIASGDDFIYCHDGRPSGTSLPSEHTCKAWGMVDIGDKGAIMGCKLIER